MYPIHLSLIQSSFFDLLVVVYQFHSLMSQIFSKNLLQDVLKHLFLLCVPWSYLYLCNLVLDCYHTLLLSGHININTPLSSPYLKLIGLERIISYFYCYYFMLAIPLKCISFCSSLDVILLLSFITRMMSLCFLRFSTAFTKFAFFIN